MTRDDIISFVITLEGGYVDNPADPGGATNFGVTQHYLEANRAAHPELTLPASVADLTQSQAATLYRLNEWTEVQGDSLPWPLALCAFDTAVNEGQHRAAITLQQALGVPADGLIGPGTLRAAQAAGTLQVKKFAAYRGVAYAQLDAKEDVFEYTWMDRLLTVYTRAILP
ncbi:MAG TPA: glycosyl hydrolase 108 family protein [Caldimonas sp.]|nr:glycosyl hydrolase 108 family protein [Caldimonas sp.]